MMPAGYRKKQSATFYISLGLNKLREPAQIVNKLQEKAGP
jgi:hypothetical protein